MSRHCTTVWDGCQNELGNLFGVPFGSAYTAAHRSAEIPELMQRGKKRGRNDSSEKGSTQNGAHFYLLCQSGAVQHKGVYKAWCKVRMFGGRGDSHVHVTCSLLFSWWSSNRHGSSCVPLSFFVSVSGFVSALHFLTLPWAATASMALRTVSSSPRNCMGLMGFRSLSSS